MALWIGFLGLYGEMMTKFRRFVNVIQLSLVRMCSHSGVENGMFASASGMSVFLKNTSQSDPLST